ncbi:MAG TPA: AAA domain-containing protein [Cyclobacteriaceae bacterium]
MNTKNNILQTFLRRLTNLSGNNRSLLLLRLHAEQLMDIHLASHLNGERSFSLINALIAGKEKKICQVLDSRLEANNEVSKRLKKLQRADRFLFEERGSNDLHVGWPFLRGKFSDGTLVRCPLLFFPVTLEIQNNNWILKPREEAGITINKSFLLAYAFYNKVKIDEDLLETNFEDFNTDSTVFRTEVYQLLKDKLEINFNPDNFRDELTTFEEFKKDAFDEAQRNGEIKLFPEAVLGIFPQAGSQLVPDYLELIDQNSFLHLEDLFTRKLNIESAINANQPIREEKLFTPFTLDAYQEHAIQAVKKGSSIVVQGPPGTGKSQLICNLMADAIASGKRALLVCQKRAALDVVYNRLNATGLGDFLGLVHDFRNDRKEIFSKIAQQVDHIEEYKAQNRSIDAIQLERRFFQVCRTIDQLTEDLEEFRKALFDDSECGLSVKELYLTSDLHAATINIKQEYQYFTFQTLHEFVRKLKVYSNYAAWFEGDDYPWCERKSFASLQFTDLKKIENVISEIPSFQRKVIDHIEQLLSARLTFEQCESFLTRESEILGLLSVLHDDETYQYFQAMINEPDDETSLLWLSNTERVLLNCFNGEGLESTTPLDQLGEVQIALQHRIESRKNFFRRIRWSLFSDSKFLIKRTLVANNLLYTKAGLKTLEGRLDNRLNFEHHLTSLKNKAWLKGLPSGYSYRDFVAWFEKQKLAIRAKISFSSLREVQEHIHVQTLSRTDFGILLRGLLEGVKDIAEKKANWLAWLSPFQVRVLTSEASLVNAFVMALKKDFDNLCEFDKLKEELLSHERDVIIRAHDYLQIWDATQLESLFQNSLRLAWIDHIETKYPILRSVSSMKMENIQQELQQLVAEKKKLSTEILMIKARDRVSENIEYNRLNNRVTYRDLYHQVTKKKKIWPVRKVISEFEQEIFNLVPCWMASPESVSAIFGMHEIFDLVIFDEASQCFSERGVPAMVRGRQLLIAGDNKQLRPSELYQVRWDEEGEHPDQEVDSLLELAERYLSTVHLQGHYRSQRMELIDFSNKHFYEGRLRLLPDRHVINLQESGIEYCKVDGVWEDQTNLVEATEVVSKVLAISREHPEKEIGVVTFNAPQQVLILDLLEEAFDAAGLVFPITLFVKNIENVQGDEKDIIIFSVGYAPDKKKKINMQFGSLNQAGGENRLNVAVTRAREKIILVTSIFPEQLKVDDIKNEGPKLLRQYLEFAREVDQKNFKPYVNNAAHWESSWYLNSKIKKWGEAKFSNLSFEPDTLPFSDLNFKKTGNYLGVILTDDSRYFESLSAKDIHAYTQALLVKKNWHYKMIFSRNYWQDRIKLEDELMRFIGTHNQ